MHDKITLTFHPENRHILANAGETIWEAANHAGACIRGECNGRGVCGKCIVSVEPAENLSAPDEDEQALLSDNGSDPRKRVACQARIKGPLTVHIPEASLPDEPVSGKTGISGTFSPDPAIRRFFVKSPPADTVPGHKNTGMAERIAEEINRCYGQKVFFQSTAAIRQLSMPACKADELTLVHHAEKGITAVYPGKQEKSLGLAFDIGTTTIAAYICDMNTGNVLFACATLNPQYRYGEDVISRVDMANQASFGLDRLQSIVVQAANTLIQTCLSEINASSQDIDDVVIVGNTVMEHIFAGIHPHGLGSWPFMPISRCFTEITAKDVGLDISPGTPVHMFPVISGFVGGDALAAVLAEIDGYPSDIRLIIDIGTNGELMLLTPEGIWATSCATGPAFEGGHLSCGMRATTGAVYKVAVDPSNNRFTCHALGEEHGARPVGVCGSGVIDAIAVMLKSGMILQNGRFDEKKPNVISDDNGIGRKIILVPKEISGTGDDIFLSIRDIRQIQLAKAAMAVGIDALLKKADIKKIDTTVLTGAFGVKFNWQHACDIGMFPPCVMTSSVEPKINLAGIGGIKALLNKNQRTRADSLQKQIHFVELSTDAEFSKAFANATRFP
ncbi:MAG: DUF4445 domain-containing protein [Proteobacteria bacterium]|nr:DUF4445 domain-containing protein [Pseudomonadota bacterium]